MAGTRVENVGTIFSRIAGMIRAGGLKWDDRPVWFDAYAAFPPKYEPRADRPAPEQVQVRQLIYPEDTIRAQFYKIYGSPGLINLTDESTPTLCETFVNKYLELSKAQPDRQVSDLVKLTEEALSRDGITFLKRKGATKPDNDQPKIE